MRLRNTLLAALALLVLAGCGAPAPAAGPAAGPDAVEVRAHQVILSHENPGVDRIDSLRFLGGLDLRSPDPRFGGFSGLDISPDGTRLLAVGDRGTWFEATLLYTADGHLRDIADARLTPILDTNGAPLASDKARDAEAIARLPDGSLVVGFEHMHRLDRFAAPRSPAQPFRAPAMLAASPPNGGAEAATALPDGRILILSERLEARPGVAGGWLGRPGDWRAVGFKRTGIFVPVGASTRDDGTVFILERRYTTIGGIGSRISLVPPELIAPGAIFEGREIAQIAPPLAADNYEGIAVRRGKAGKTLIYLISDDNFSDLQRTLLMLFALEE
jgi:hypothetical protein